MPTKSIFVLEDNHHIQEIITIVLEEEGFQVDAFSSVGAFKKAIQLKIPDVFLLDVMLPDGNGLEVCEILKKNQTTSEIPVIIMTANEDILKQMKHSMADDLIRKPFDIDVLAHLATKWATT